jgi:peptidoglycan/xylan/chitin deacetylase (PgdA/CDA1 family)
MLSEARAKVGHRLAMHLRVDLFQLRNSTPMVSFTFDDLPKSAVTTGAEMLEAHGARGTFYVSGSLVGADAPDWVAGDAEDVVALHRGGHEIGCHTYSHQRACDLDETAMRQEIRRNSAYLRALDLRYRSIVLPTRSDTAPTPGSVSSGRRSRPAAASCRASTSAASTCSSCAPCR